MRRLSFERSRCLACRSREIACDRLVGALLCGDVSHAGEYFRRYREAVARPTGAE
jgi:hypothetical protein